MGVIQCSASQVTFCSSSHRRCSHYRIYTQLYQTRGWCTIGTFKGLRGPDFRDMLNMSLYQTGSSRDVSRITRGNVVHLEGD